MILNAQEKRLEKKNNSVSQTDTENNSFFTNDIKFAIFLISLISTFLLLFFAANYHIDILVYLAFFTLLRFNSFYTMDFI